jgi:hypothetical protein
MTQEELSQAILDEMRKMNASSASASATSLTLLYVQLRIQLPKAADLLVILVEV